MSLITLGERLHLEKIGAKPLDLRGSNIESKLWLFPSGWVPVTPRGLPESMLLSGCFDETVSGQTSVTMTMGWALIGRTDAMRLLDGCSDPLPPGGKLISRRTVGPVGSWCGANMTIHNVYLMEGGEFFSSTRFDIVANDGAAENESGILLQRIYHSPIKGERPRCVEITKETVDMLNVWVGHDT